MKGTVNFCYVSQEGNMKIPAKALIAKRKFSTVGNKLFFKIMTYLPF